MEDDDDALLEESKHNTSEEEEGDDLMDNADDDYQAIQQLDHYEEKGLDDGSHEELSAAGRHEVDH